MQHQSLSKFWSVQAKKVLSGNFCSYANDSELSDKWKRENRSKKTRRWPDNIFLSENLDRHLINITIMKVIRFLSRFIPTMLVGITILYLSLSHVTSPYNVPNIQNLDKIVHFTMYMGLVSVFCFDVYRSSWLSRYDTCRFMGWSDGTIPKILYWIPNSRLVRLFSKHGGRFRRDLNRGFHYTPPHSTIQKKQIKDKTPLFYNQILRAYPKALLNKIFPIIFKMSPNWFLQNIFSKQTKKQVFLFPDL